MRNTRIVEDEENKKLVDIIFWNDRTIRTTFNELQKMLGIKNILRNQVKTYRPVKRQLA
jgi:hypothetical protein